MTNEPESDESAGDLAGDIAGPMARLEAALDRIAYLSVAGSARPPSPAVSQLDSSDMAARLDTMIARLRTAIDE